MVINLWYREKHGHVMGQINEGEKNWECQKNDRLSYLKYKKELHI